MKKTKKILSLLLAVLMLLSVVPMAYAEGEVTYKVGDIVSFGSYPQTEVKEKALIAKLNTLAPEWDDWTSYGYYSGTESNGDLNPAHFGSMMQGDWMRYVDIKHDGNKYRGVKFTNYRSAATVSLSELSFQPFNGYYTNTTYWFKFEPIDWRVLDPATGLVMCETIIDAQAYSNTIYYNGNVSEEGDCFEYVYHNDASFTNYVNDYETSSIRQWLNNDFYNTAFADVEKQEINTTTINNDSNSIDDKIFLLSYDEVTNSDFGFNSDAEYCDEARQTQGSDYAKSQGFVIDPSADNFSLWLLCYYGPREGFIINAVDNEGSLHNDGVFVSGTYGGIRPALRVNLDSEILNQTPEIPDEPQEETEDDLFVQIFDLIKMLFDLIASMFKK
jgi:hypothetical protein